MQESFSMAQGQLPELKNKQKKCLWCTGFNMDHQSFAEMLQLRSTWNVAALFRLEADHILCCASL